MENTLENKAKFFAQYWGQKIRVPASNFPKTEAHTDFVGYLELTPLSQITDEDAVKLGYGNAIHLKKNISFNIDELRGLGYALSFHGLSVEDLVEYGWIKLKEK